MKIFLLILLSIISFGCAETKLIHSRPSSNYQFSVLQGQTDEQSTLIRVVYPKGLTVNYRVTNAIGTNFPVRVLKSFTRKASEFKVDHIKVTEISINETYKLNISSDNKRWKDERNFKALDTKKNSLKILVASCMNDAFNEIGNDIWPKAFDHHPDVSFLIGDNIYADTFSGIYLGSQYLVTPSHLWNRYIDHAMKLKIYRLKDLTPTYVTWDDHDYGKNNGGKSYKYKKEAKELLNVFFPRANGKNFSYGPGVSSSLKLSGMNFLFLDGRSFRTDKSKREGAHFGQKQRKWINKELRSSPFSWLISGDQFYGGYHPFESFQGDHPKTFKNFVEDLKKSKNKVAFMSGDRHLLEIMKIPREQLGYETFEYTISGVHTKMYPGSIERDQNPLRVGGFDGDANYAIIETHKTGKVFDIVFKGYSDKKLRVQSKQTIKVK